ncbi:gliding motility-associated-like protein [Chryseobacterium ginsenosidimutans]|uniref:choice-of-anchor L domain-containing protein n=1 Tax=Chryseobacterium ginsenosidimutans TaxID=687846 RepID=UPI002784C906|nr:choice-of-anchor L domain-containing protein [Chryseobacterium ginsenosidimutans]MDQ0593797.1 gliding motility-associated-like protein [Chryseobacterium ginsenosidimutans]
MLNYRIKNYFFFLVLLLVSGSVFAQKKVQRKPSTEKATSESFKAGLFIDVNAASYTPSSYTIEQLVKNILISGGSSCAVANVTNVTVSPNQLSTDPERAWGYFHKGTTNFPFTDGVVLVTGKARRAGNVFEGSLGDPVPGSTVSDPDLVTAIAPLAPLKDAVFIEFDFVPNSTQVKFNYLFASEEYTSDYPCGVFSDGFALLLKKVGDPTYTNLAVLPGTAGPVSVTNIVPAGNGFSCGPINEAYFGGMNPPTNIETNFNGRTIPLTAQATVIPGQTYHFKMVLADASDSGFDSAVFLEGGSFDIGMTIVDGNGNPLTTVNMCDNTPQLLKAQIAAVPGMTFQWYKDDVLIPGATNATYTATQPGVYIVRTFVGGTNCQTATVTIVGGTTPPAQNATLKLCTTPSLAAFNLNDATPMITSSTTATVHYYVNQSDAVAQNNNYLSAAALSNYPGTDGQVLYVVVSNGAFCSKTVTLTLNKETTPIAQLTATKVRICAGESTTLTAANGATYQWSTLPGTGATQVVSPTQTTTYSVYAIGAQGCKSLQPASIVVEVVPAITSMLSGGMICQGDVITLDAGAGPNYHYTWSTGDTTQTISVGTPGTYSVIINNGVCTKEFTTQVIQAIIPEIINVNYNENGTMMLTASNPSNGSLEYSIDNGLTWQNSNTFTNVPRNIVVSIRVRVKKTSCVGFLQYFTFVMQNVITPNGDNINDIIDFRGVNKYKDFKASIFDRYGKEVYKASSLQPYWDGYFQGKRLNTSSYWYQVSFEDPASKKPALKTGWILLKNFE